MNKIVQLKNVQKRFGDNIALDNISVNFNEGCIHGLLGHNGAGKTTLIRIIGGTYKQDKGEVDVLGLNPIDDGYELRKNIGVLSENMCMYDRLSIYDNLMFYGKLYNIEKKELKSRIDNYLKMFQISEFKDKLIKDCSTGMKKKTGIIRAIINEPKLLLLDEASNGLDPISKDEFHELIKELVKIKKISVVLCSHDLEEVKKLCEYITIIKEGKIVYSDNVNSLSRNKESIGIEINTIQDLFKFKEQIQKELKENKIDHAEFNRNSVKLDIPSLNDVNTVIKVLMKYNLNIINVEHKIFDLNKVYLDSHREENAI
ncbi:ABC transporter ATP-binding protein [Tissierella sp. MB52-C2]|uniref:ABC transporter ATP-binding protein n=1 Tax=Tissierella sp. MB52-C2 TaxID=3070999 RepID=UPI00280BAA11|nr:ABC transporter ATP-binding protein [Tissierella sp. MB52-C2]WMM25974.1 ABC transporter ATP-binding protein [Tissierella sp. MB52-C2]